MGKKSQTRLAFYTNLTRNFTNISEVEGNSKLLNINMDGVSINMCKDIVDNEMLIKYGTKTVSPQKLNKYRGLKGVCNSVFGDIGIHVKFDQDNEPLIVPVKSQRTNEIDEVVLFAHFNTTNRELSAINLCSGVRVLDYKENKNRLALIIHIKNRNLSFSIDFHTKGRQNKIESHIFRFRNSTLVTKVEETKLNEKFRLEKPVRIFKYSYNGITEKIFVLPQFKTELINKLKNNDIRSSSVHNDIIVIKDKNINFGERPVTFYDPLRSEEYTEYIKAAKRTCSSVYVNNGIKQLRIK